MSILEETYHLADGTSIPRLGLGTWLMGDAEAYSPIAHGMALDNPLVVETAARYGVTSAQLRALLPAAGPAAAAQDRQPRPHRQQRRGGLRAFRRGHGRAQDRRTHPRLRRLELLPRLWRQAVGACEAAPTTAQIGPPPQASHFLHGSYDGQKNAGKRTRHHA